MTDYQLRDDGRKLLAMLRALIMTFPCFLGNNSAEHLQFVRYLQEQRYDAHHDFGYSKLHAD